MSTSESTAACGCSRDDVLALPAIGAQSTLADLLRLLGHAPVEGGPVFEPRFLNRRVHRGQALVFANQPLESLYVVLSGSFRNTLNGAAGTQQVVGFPMRGDLIGLDAIRSGRYPVTVRALEEANAAALPYRELVDLARTCAQIEQTIMTAVSAELLRNYEVMRAIGVLGAEARLARFLHLLCERGARFGFSRGLLRLSMTRADIASYLGLSVETVCRAFTSLTARGIIDVRRRTVRVLDRERFEHADSIEPHSMQRACAAARRRAPKSAAAVPAAPRAPAAVN